jgi:ribosomal protein S18 acetylase RimI-like enzyme
VAARSEAHRATIFAKIEPLSRVRLASAAALANRVFGDDAPGRWFRTSLDRSLYADTVARTFDPNGVPLPGVRYWTATDKTGQVVGTTGLYEYASDRYQASWLGWMCVEPRARGRKIGQSLVEKAIGEARADGKAFLRLYTSTDPNEAAAQRLYEKLGLRVVRRLPPEAGSRYAILLRELALSPRACAPPSPT